MRYRPDDYRFLAKWVGYPASDSTWEPRENLPVGTVAAWEKLPAANSSAEPVFEVERLVRYRPIDGHFLVKWVGVSANGEYLGTEGAAPSCDGGR